MGRLTIEQMQDLVYRTRHKAYRNYAQVVQGEGLKRVAAMKISVTFCCLMFCTLYSQSFYNMGSEEDTVETILVSLLRVWVEWVVRMEKSQGDLETSHMEKRQERWYGRTILICNENISATGCEMRLEGVVEE